MKVKKRAMLRAFFAIFSDMLGVGKFNADDVVAAPPSPLPRSGNDGMGRF